MNRIPIETIRELPTTTDALFKRYPDFVDASRLHESLFRAFNILDRVKWLLQQGCSAPVVLQEIAEMEASNASGGAAASHSQIAGSSGEKERGG